MSEKNPTLQDIWRLLGKMNGRFESLEREMVALKTEVSKLRADMEGGFSALKGSIEARDFRLDDHGRRLAELERSR